MGCGESKQKVSADVPLDVPSTLASSAPAGVPIRAAGTVSESLVQLKTGGAYGEADSADKGAVAPDQKASPPPETKGERAAAVLHDSAMSSQRAATPQEDSEAGEAATMIFQIEGEEAREITVRGVHPDAPDLQGPPALPPDEQLRCRHAIERLGIDLQSPEPALDFITQLCARICGMASAVITFMDDKHVYLKSNTMKEFKPRVPADRRLAVTSWMSVPLKPSMLVVEDLVLDHRFASHPSVRQAHMRFIAAAPLLDASGQRLGALAVFDVKPRRFDAEQCNVLCNFAEMVVRELQRLADAALQETLGKLENRQLLRAMDACSHGVVLLEASQPRWPLLFSNHGWSQRTGMPPNFGSGKCFWDTFSLAAGSNLVPAWDMYKDAVNQGHTFTLRLADSSGSKFLVTFKPATTEQVDSSMISISIPAQRPPPSPSTPEKSLPRWKLYFGILPERSEGDLASYLSSGGSSNTHQSLAKQTTGNRRQPPIPGLKLGPLLGKGSFGKVYHGVLDGEQVAVKIVEDVATRGEHQAQKQQLEATLGLKLGHPSVIRTLQYAVQLHDVANEPSNSPKLTNEIAPFTDEPGSVSGSANGSAAYKPIMMETWIVLELCTHGSLQEAIDLGAFQRSISAGKTAPDMPLIVHIALEIAAGMAHLHSLDILHSDLNGNNILLTGGSSGSAQPFTAKVSDFGLSRIHAGEKTLATQTYGTVTHMPPELLSEGRLSKAADVYAFGVILWEMYTGDRPWAGLRHAQIITRKLYSSSALTWPPGEGAAFKALAEQCMLQDYCSRPTFTEVVQLMLSPRHAAQ